MDEKFNITCRTCLTEQGEFKSLFKNHENCNMQIAEMLMSFTSLQISFEDGLPQNICENCANKILQAYYFTLKCEESDVILRNKFITNSVENTLSGITQKANFDLGIDPHHVDIVIKTETLTEERNVNTENDSSENDFHNQGDCTEDTNDYFDTTNEHKQEGEETRTITKYSKVNRSAQEKAVCNVCLKEFQSAGLLNKHKKSHESLKCTCPTCAESAEKKIPDTQCMICNETFVSRDEYITHILTHTEAKGDSIVECHICHKKLTKTPRISRHLRTHAAIKPHTCQLCNKSFSRADQLNSHINVHSGIKPHICNLCGKGFTQVSNLRDHMRTHNGEKPFLCSVCGKGFNQVGNLKQHTVRHSGIKAHLCSVCGNGFASKGELGAHMRKHTGARPFVCSVCNHGFTTSSSLTKHKRIHSGEKPYECDVCRMKFARSGILARHKRTHTGEKPYKCKFCGKAFTQSNDLAAHLRIHTGEKPFICDTCGQAFRQKSALKSHKKIHTLNDWSKKTNVSTQACTPIFKTYLDNL
ncbi:zinc finger protein OZF-like [Agrilus planipennis]|uniref:Zinc finger protein OZF-like n=1 Tax=Agrilus planipennis TaxID=224129 RepID=A0A7F5QXI9_AGRPL|nr:zinc finger protein OZF-like [Agrilus planipennis]